MARDKTKDPLTVKCPASLTHMSSQSRKLQQTSVILPSIPKTASINFFFELKYILQRDKNRYSFQESNNARQASSPHLSLLTDHYVLHAQT
jgi:hypothetical protein